MLLERATMIRRSIVRLLNALGLASVCALAMAQGYPAKPVRVIIPNPPGGSLDIVARLVGPKMTELSARACSLITAPVGQQSARSWPRAADGYTALLHSLLPGELRSLFAKLPFDPVRDFAPVSLDSGAFVPVVHNSAPAKTVKELIALAARAQPGKLTYSSAGNGAISTWPRSCSTRWRGRACSTFSTRAWRPGAPRRAGRRSGSLISTSPRSCPTSRAAGYGRRRVQQGTFACPAGLPTVADSGAGLVHSACRRPRSDRDAA